MSEKTREICTVVSQESIGAGIYSMWIQTDRIAADAKPGQFVSLYTNDKSKILPRPISLCEIDKENGRLHLVYRVTGQGTGTDEFSQMKAGVYILLFVLEVHNTYHQGNRIHIYLYLVSNL